MERIDRIELLLEELLIAQKETEIQAAKTEALFAKTEAQIAKSEIRVAKNEEQLKRTMQELSNVGHNNGEFAEYYFYNALCETKTLGGITYDYVDKNVGQRSKRLQDEFDIVMYNGNSIALIECKYKAHEKDLTLLVESKTKNFKLLNPDYANYNIYCGLASFTFYPELEEQAKQLGVAILKQNGELMEVNADNLIAY
jgi:hypothetical protein